MGSTDVQPTSQMKVTLTSCVCLLNAAWQLAIIHCQHLSICFRVFSFSHLLTRVMLNTSHFRKIKSNE